LSGTALLSIPVGVVVERHKATSPWLDYLWRPATVLPGVPSAVPWTLLSTDGDKATFYGGPATIELHRTETANYIGNLDSDHPLLWVVLRQTGRDPPVEVQSVTADPAEGEAYTEAGNDLVETVPMPAPIAEAIAGFVAQHHIERPFFKRQRDRLGPDRQPTLPRREDEHS
jgi:hypothetical protein